MKVRNTRTGKVGEVTSIDGNTYRILQENGRYTRWVTKNCEDFQEDHVLELPAPVQEVETDPAQEIYTASWCGEDHVEVFDGTKARIMGELVTIGCEKWLDQLEICKKYQPDVAVFSMYSEIGFDGSFFDPLEWFFLTGQSFFPPLSPLVRDAEPEYSDEPSALPNYEPTPYIYTGGNHGNITKSKTGNSLPSGRTVRQGVDISNIMGKGHGISSGSGSSKHSPALGHENPAHRQTLQQDSGCS